MDSVAEEKGEWIWGRNEMNIFLSSTYLDLLEHRTVVDQALRSLCQVRGMELFGARPEEPTRVCIEELSQCQVLIGIYAYRYGTIPKGGVLSITEQEFDFAQVRGIKCLCYFVSPQHVDPQPNKEVGKEKEVKCLKDKISTRVTPDYFTSPDNLACNVSAGITQLLLRDGLAYGAFVDADKYYEPFMKNDGWLSHVFPMVGRERTLAELEKFFEDECSKIGLLVGTGGVGKSKVLFEWAKRHPDKDEGKRVLFLRERDIDNDLLQVLPKCRVIIIDDAHRKKDIDRLVACIASDDSTPKLLLCCRPHGRAMLRSVIYKQPLAERRCIEFTELGPLSKDETRKLTSDIIGTNHLRVIEPLVAALGDSPLMSVIGARYIKEQAVHPSLISNDLSFRRAILDRFCQEILESAQQILTGIDPRSLIYLIAALNPLPLRNPKVNKVASSFLNIPTDMFNQAVDSLVEARLLTRVGDTARLAPDVIADAFLEEACFAASTETNTGYASRVFEHFSNVCPEIIIRNLAEVDWRLGFEKSRDLLADIWKALGSACENTDRATVAAGLDLISEIAHLQPAQALNAIRHPIEMVKSAGAHDDSSLIFGNMENTVIDILSSVGGYRAYAAFCANELWEIGRDGKKPVFSSANKAIQALQSIAGYGLFKDVRVSYEIFKCACQWAKEQGWEDHIYSVFDVLDPILRKEDEEVRSEGAKVSFISFGLRPYGWRKKVVEKIIELGRNSSEKTTLRAIESLSKVANLPHGGKGRRITNEELQGWLPERRLALEGLLAVARAKNTPTTVDKARQVAKEHLHCSDLADLCRAILDELQESFDVRLTMVLRGSLHHDFVYILRSSEKQSCHKDFKNAINDFFNSVTQEILEHVKSAHALVELLEYRMENMVQAGLTPSPQPLIQMLATKASKLCAESAVLVSENPASLLTYTLSVLIQALAHENREKAQELISRLLIHGSQSQIQQIVLLFEYGGWLSDAGEVEIEQLQRGLSSESDDVKCGFLKSVHCLPERHRKTALGILCNYDIGGSVTLCEAFFTNFGQHAIPYKELDSKTVTIYLGKLLQAQEIGQHEYQTDQFLEFVAAQNPAALISLFLQRIEYAKKHEDFAYRPVCMFNDWPTMGTIQKDQRKGLLREVRDKIISENGTNKRNLIALFWALGGADIGDCMLALEEVVESDSEEIIISLAQIIDHHHAQLIVQHPDFFLKIIQRAESCSPNAVKVVLGNLKGVVQCQGGCGILGQPFPEHVAFRDAVTKLLPGIPTGTPTYEFYDWALKHTEREIQKQLALGKELERA